jgi:hypothetical protein
MTVESSADEVVLGESRRSGRPTKRVEQVPDHVEMVDEWSDFIDIIQRVCVVS